MAPSTLTGPVLDHSKVQLSYRRKTRITTDFNFEIRKQTKGQSFCLFFLSCHLTCGGGGGHTLQRPSDGQQSHQSTRRPVCFCSIFIYQTDQSFYVSPACGCLFGETEKSLLPFMVVLMNCISVNTEGMCCC